MVATTPSTPQTNELDRKRRQTLERARANHLSRQLQMRLQYAKLKVEHGWQKQNLNEVENLYFRHSHLRGTRSQTASLLATTHRDPTAFPSSSSSSHQSSLSFKMGASNLSRSSTLTNVTTPLVEGLLDDGSSHAPNTHADLKPPSLVMMGETSIEMGKPDSTPEEDTSSPPIVDAVANSPGGKSSTTPPNPATWTPKPPQSSFSGRPPNLDAPSYRSSPQLTSPSLHHTTPNADPFGFSSSTSLTYDSFWSSHSTQATARSLRPSSSGNGFPPSSIGNLEIVEGVSGGASTSLFNGVASGRS